MARGKRQGAAARRMTQDKTRRSSPLKKTMKSALKKTAKIPVKKNLKSTPKKRKKSARRKAAGAWFEKLAGVMARLRAPGGCPWDREQTHATLRTYLIEEAYEVLEALDGADDVKFAEELGDLLLQVVFHAQMADEGSGGRRGSGERAGWSATELAGAAGRVSVDAKGGADRV